jgi:hypothetical protein
MIRFTLCIMVYKTHNWGKFAKWRARIGGYCLFLCPIFGNALTLVLYPTWKFNIILKLYFTRTFWSEFLFIRFLFERRETFLVLFVRNDTNKSYVKLLWKTLRNFQKFHRQGYLISMNIPPRKEEASSLSSSKVYICEAPQLLRSRHKNPQTPTLPRFHDCICFKFMITFA